MAILAILFRMRVAVLAVLGLGTIAAAWFAFYPHPPSVLVLALAAVSLLIGWAIAAAHLRHAGLAVLSVLAPLPGMIAAQPFAQACGVTLNGLLPVYAFAAIAAACLAGAIARRILDASTAQDAARHTLAHALAPTLLAVLVGAALLVAWLFRPAQWQGIGTAATLAAAALSVLAVVPFGASVLPFGETFFVAANRARERRESALRLATQVVEPRWGFALGGAALVLAVVGWFGVEPFLRHSALLAQPALWGGGALLAFLLSFAAGRDWRDALAATLALAVLSLLDLFLCGRILGHLTAAAFLANAIAAASALFLILSVIVQSRSYRRAGDGAAVARLRALEDAGWAPWFGSVGAAAALLPWIAAHGSFAILVPLFPLACAAALLGMPALATVLESLIARRRSVADLYGRG